MAVPVVSTGRSFLLLTDSSSFDERRRFRFAPIVQVTGNGLQNLVHSKTGEIANHSQLHTVCTATFTTEVAI